MAEGVTAPQMLTWLGRDEPQLDTVALAACDRVWLGCYGGRRGRVGPRQPEAQGPHSRLDQEGDGEDSGPSFQQATIPSRDGWDTGRKIGHIESTGDAVDQADPDQKPQ